MPLLLFQKRSLISKALRKELVTQTQMAAKAEVGEKRER